jgi:hypothetical protein
MITEVFNISPQDDGNLRITQIAANGISVSLGVNDTVILPVGTDLYLRISVPVSRDSLVKLSVHH